MQIAESGDASALLTELAQQYEDSGQYALLFESLIVAKRFSLGLPMVGDLSSLEPDDPRRAELEEHYAEACRRVGRLFLEGEDIGQAFPYFRTVQDLDPIRDALHAWAKQPQEEREAEAETYLEIALTQGLDPELGYGLLIEQRGVCDAITYLEQQFPFGASVRLACVELLVRALHGELIEALQRDLEKHEGERRPDLKLIEILEGRRWLFRNNRCHVDDSHLQAVIRFSVVLENPDDLRRAVELCVYGMHLPKSYQHQEGSPFEDFYNDYRILLSGLEGHETSQALEHFQAKLDRQAEENPRGTHFPAEVFAFLQYRSGQAEGAIQTFTRFLKQSPRLSLCPPLIDLCRTAGNFEPFLATAEEKKNTLQYAIGLIEKYGLKP